MTQGSCKLLACDLNTGTGTWPLCFVDVGSEIDLKKQVCVWGLHAAECHSPSMRKAWKSSGSEIISCGVANANFCLGRNFVGMLPTMLER